MVKSLFNVFLSCVLLLSSTILHAQYNESLLSQNNELLILTEEVMQDAETAFLERKVDTTFRNPLIVHLEKIHAQAMERRTFLYEASSIKNSTTRTIFRPKLIKHTNRRMVAEWNNFEKEMMFCNASKRIIKMVDQFKDTKKVYFANRHFLIPRAYHEEAKKTYSSIVDSMFSVANSFPKMEFVATIHADGYADEATTSKGSALYNNMVYRMGKEPLTNTEINNYVSYLRAYDLASILRDYVKDEKERFNNSENLSINITQKGNGTMLPDYEKEYKPIDENRRIVKVRWHILPKF